jgi:hypothetical protein
VVIFEDFGNGQTKLTDKVAAVVAGLAQAK